MLSLYLLTIFTACISDDSLKVLEEDESEENRVPELSALNIAGTLYND